MRVCVCVCVLFCACACFFVGRYLLAYSFPIILRLHCFLMLVFCRCFECVRLCVGVVWVYVSVCLCVCVGVCVRACASMCFKVQMVTLLFLVLREGVLKKKASCRLLQV